jgi:hypothetical protein
VSQKNFILTLTGKEIEMLQNLGLIVILQYERAGKDPGDLKRVMRKIAKSKDRREVEIPPERLAILEEG